MTLNDLKRLSSPYFAFFRRFARFLRTVVEDRPIVRTILSPSFSLSLLAKTITHTAARFLCDSWASYSTMASLLSDVCFSRVVRIELSSVRVLCEAFYRALAYL